MEKISFLPSLVRPYPPSTKPLSSLAIFLSPFADLHKETVQRKKFDAFDVFEAADLEFLEKSSAYLQEYVSLAHRVASLAELENWISYLTTLVTSGPQ